MNAHDGHPNYEADNCPRCGTAQARMGQMDPSAIVGTQPILSAMPIKVWASGANMVGYLPEGDVFHTLDYDSAKSSLIDDLDRYGDSEQSWVDEHDCDDIPCPTYGDRCGWNLAEDASAAMEDLNLCAESDANGGEFHAYIGNLHFWLVVNTPEYFGLDEEGLAELGWEADEVPMQFVVNIATDNDAFAEDSNAEVARILRKIADRLESNSEIAGSVNDVNGNSVGTFCYEAI